VQVNGYSLNLNIFTKYITCGTRYLGHYGAVPATKRIHQAGLAGIGFTRNYDMQPFTQNAPTIGHLAQLLNGIPQSYKATFYITSPYKLDFLIGKIQR